MYIAVSSGASVRGPEGAQTLKSYCHCNDSHVHLTHTLRCSLREGINVFGFIPRWTAKIIHKRGGLGGGGGRGRGYGVATPRWSPIFSFFSIEL